MHSGYVVSECGYLILYRVVLEETDGCIGGGSFSEYISVLVGFRIRSRSNEFICPLFSYVGLNVMSLCVWFIFVVIRSDCILLESYIIKKSAT
jgi:hypothetical protein